MFMEIVKIGDRIETLNDKGELHSFDGNHAVETSDGSKFWYKEGKRHRLNRPAIEFNNGCKFWYKEGEFHRLDGPAVEFIDGGKSWFKEGKRHRLDGPATERTDGSKGWYYEGKEIECESTEEFLKIINLKAFW